MRTAWRRLRFGLATLLGPEPRGFFIPYRYADTVRPSDHPALEPVFRDAAPSMLAILSAIEGYAAALAALQAAGPARFDQDWFPRLDALAVYALTRSRKPRRIVEIGSGHSTRFLARAVADEGCGTRIVCIDPAPRAALASLEVTWIPRVLGAEDDDLLASLTADDMLFIDSSHVAMPGTDVERLVLDILPRLAPGVLIHIHDILLPDAYPAEWDWRGYNEQIVVGALIQGGAYEVLWSSRWAATRLGAQLGPVVGGTVLVEGAIESSLWLVKRNPALAARAE
jgi:predicted O-methyltransferase YrrM